MTFLAFCIGFLCGGLPGACVAVVLLWALGFVMLCLDV